MIKRERERGMIDMKFRILVRSLPVYIKHFHVAAFSLALIGAKQKILKNVGS